MLNLYEKDKVYYDDFNFYFDRSRNINIIFSFNFMQLLKDQYPEIEEKYLYLFKDKFDIKVFLTRKEEFHDFYENIENVSKIQLFQRTQFFTFFCKKEARKFKGKYKILVRVSYNPNLNSYIDEKLLDRKLSQTEFNNLKAIKIINEKKYSFFEKKSDVVLDQYEFLSDDIDFDYENYYISNLYEIYNDTITYSSLSEFFNSSENVRGISRDRKLTTNYYIEDDIPYALDYNFNDKMGQIKNYYNLIIKIFRNSRQIKNYKQLDIIQNIFSSINSNNHETNSRNRSISPYEKLSNSLESTICDNNLFSSSSESSKILRDSDILLLSFCFKNVPTLEINEFWTNDISLLPVYILDILTRYSIYYLKNIDEQSMQPMWNILNIEEMDKLTTGNYLCKISSNQQFLCNSLMENYFILNK